MTRFDAPHGGYPGDVIAHTTYLGCTRCGYSYPLDTFGPSEPCDCGGELIELRATPAPEPTVPMFRFS